MKRILVFGAVVMAALGSVAADAVSSEAVAMATNAVSIDALVAQALRENPELQFYRAELVAAKAGRKAAGLMPNPELSGLVGQKHSRDVNTGLSAEGVAWSVSLDERETPRLCRGGSQGLTVPGIRQGRGMGGGWAHR